MSSRLGYHIQAPQYPDWLKEHVARSGCEWVKIINPHEGEAEPFGPDITYIGRLWWKGEPDKELIKEGAAGAETWVDMAYQSMAICQWVTAWEGPNEPAVATERQAHNLADFERRRVEIMGTCYFETVSFCFGTGNPPYLALWRILGSALADTDYLALHEYGMRTMKLDGWHLLRYRKVIAELRDAGHRVPPIIIGETGIDYNGNPHTDGWRAQGISQMDYVAQLAAYDQELQKDPEVVAATPFTWMDLGWPSFDIDRFTSRLLSSYMREQNMASKTFEQQMGDYMQRHVIPQNEDAAFYLYGRAHGWEPVSPEASVRIGNITYRAQVWYDQVDQHIVFAVVDHWDAIGHFDREN